MQQTVNTINREKIPMKLRHTNTPAELRNVCLFSSFSFTGVVEEYVYFYLTHLKRAGFSIIFISTSELSPACVERLSSTCFMVIERENQCPDFGSWKTGLSMINWAKGLDAVLLVNDSVFGPFHDLDPIITSMKDKYDVWGMTTNLENELHIQSYFIYFNRAAISSSVFAPFWENIDLNATKQEVIDKYEVGLSKLFRKNNFKLGAYVDIDTLKQNELHSFITANPLLLFWKVLLSKYSFPFLKRELLIKSYISNTYWMFNLHIHVGGWKRLIERNSSYPTANILLFLSNYCKHLQHDTPGMSLQKRKILFVAPNNLTFSYASVDILKSIKSATDAALEIIVTSKNEHAKAQFTALGTVTSFAELGGTEKRNLKERLADEIAVIVWGSIENMEIRNFLSLVRVPHIIFATDHNDNILEQINAEQADWLRKNTVHFITNSLSVQQMLIQRINADSSNITLLSPSTIENGFSPETDPIQIVSVVNNYYDKTELMLAERPVITFLTHIYYENSWTEIKQKLKNFDNGQNRFLFSISEACLVKNEIIADIKISFKDACYLVTSNVGKDIGGKMALIDIYLLMEYESDYIVFLHDKQSPHSVIGESWKKGLFKIIDINYQRKILAAFHDPKTGIVGDKNYIINEYDNNTDRFINNNQISKKLLAHFDVNIQNYDFLGGSIYWIRSSVIQHFFSKNHPIDTRENLEAGNVLDQEEERLAHSWERMFSWIATAEGYSIKGI